MMALENFKSYKFTGVKPKCVQGRWIDAKFDASRRSVLIQEYFTNEKCKHICTASIPDCVKDRIIGRPICVACYDDIFVVQYVTEKCKFARFFMIDTTKSSVQCFEDAEHYFHKDFTLLYPVECLINPGLTKALFRLPQPIMSSRKWSKLLTANITPCTETVAEGIHIDNVQCHGLRDRKNQAVAFHPLHSGRVAHVLLDEYCINCKILLYDLNTKKNIIQREHKLSFQLDRSESNEENSKSESDSDSDTDDTCYEDLTYHFLEQCNIDYSKNGEILALCCVVQNSDSTESLVRIFLFSSQTLQLLQKQQYNLKELNVSFMSDKRHLVAPIFGFCDSYVSPWLLERGKTPHCLDVHLRLPKSPYLQGICREVILKACRNGDLLKLDLPSKLLNFLRFKVT